MKTVKIRNTILGEGLPKICIPITATNSQELEQQAHRVIQARPDMVEWRADYFEPKDGGAWLLRSLEVLRELLGDVPLLFTFRTKEEGGEREISRDSYGQLCEEAAASGMADLVDVELNRGEALLQNLTERLHTYGVRVVGSYHDFSMTPPKQEIISILCRIQSLGADITKAALMPRTERDVLELLDAALAMKEKYADRPYITMSMGRLGAVSRLAGGLTGSAVTFATAGRASAPGQMEAEPLGRLLGTL